MKKNNTMRMTAGVLYFIAFGVELYLFRPLYTAYSLMAVPVATNALLILALGAAAVWMLAGQGLVNRTAGRAVCVCTGLVIVKSLVMYELENELLTYSLTELLPSLAESNIWNYVFIVLRLMLMIVAAFFLLTASEGNKETVEEEAGDEAALDGEDDEELLDVPDVDDEEAQAEKDRLKEIESGMDKTLPGNDR